MFSPLTSKAFKVTGIDLIATHSHMLRSRAPNDGYQVIALARLRSKILPSGYLKVQTLDEIVSFVARQIVSDYVPITATG